jgi:hypothetical protein
MELLRGSEFSSETNPILAKILSWCWLRICLRKGIMQVDSTFRFLDSLVKFKCGRSYVCLAVKE